MMDKALRDRLDTSRFRIIDAHAHLGYYGPFDIPGDCMDDLVEQMDRTGVEKMAISPMIALGLDVPYGNDMTEAFLQRHPGRFIGMAVVNGNRPEEILPELERCFTKMHMSMIKLHPAEANCPMTSPAYDRVYGFANEHRLAILNHDWQSPALMEKLVRKYPNVQLIQAHSAGNWDGHRQDDYFRVARDNENAFVDIVASPIFYDALEKLIPLAGEDNILFGSDAPFLSLSFEVGKVMMADLSDEIKQKIFATNFVRLMSRTSRPLDASL